MFILLTIFWFVQFTNKLGSAPITFSERATENRIKWNIPTDSLDYAVVPAYLDSVRNRGAHICHVSRWMNGCTIEADSATMLQIATLPFVKQIDQTRNNVKSARATVRKFQLTDTDTDTLTDTNNSSLVNTAQLKAYNLLPLHQMGFEGQNIRIAVIDIGFHKVNTAPCFDSVRSRIIGAYNFSADATDIYGKEGQHGANCLSFIAAQTSTYYGAATKAEYIVIRTEEYSTESPKECDNLIAAYELCDSLGVNIISTSLGYRLFDDKRFDLNYNMLDGRSTRVSRAATIAARKGILICQSAGNDATNEEWNRISVPSDADSILTIGANTLDSVVSNFSSYGPSADGRIKPEVSAVGTNAVYWNTYSNQAATGNGTSYSTPLVAGLAACLWSALPDASAQEIRQLLIKSAHFYPNYDPLYQMGYGIPDALKAYQSSPAGLPEVQNTGSALQQVGKMIIDGQLYILRDGKMYNAQGMISK